MSYEYLNLLCMGCFSRSTDDGRFCTTCGYDRNSEPQYLYHLPPGTILGGKYMIGKVLGEGGFGITYIAYDLNMDAVVAVKEYYPTGLVTRSTVESVTVRTYGGEHGDFFKKGRERFVDEAKRLARFRALPGIVSVIDFLIENGTAYIVMEFVQGRTLKDYLAENNDRLPPEQVLSMMAPIFTSLAQIHRSGLIHRDISPDNIMIAPDGGVKLIDFGAAREFSDEDNKSLSVMLKHGYAPMEQYTSKGQQGPHTDVYGLSATIYKAITGITPEGSMDRILDDTLDPPRRLGVELPEYQQAALMKGLAVRQSDRFKTISELQIALTSNQVVPDLSPGLSAKPMQRVDKYPVKKQPLYTNIAELFTKKRIAAALIAALCIIAVVISFIITKDGPPPDTPDQIEEPDETEIDAPDEGSPLSDGTEVMPEPEAEPDFKRVLPLENVIVSIAAEYPQLQNELSNIAMQYNCISASLVAYDSATGEFFNFEYGQADAATRRPVNVDTKYRVAGLANLTTAICAMVLADEGIIDLDADISQYLGYRVRNAYYPESILTTRMLMQHTSSLFDSRAFFSARDGKSNDSLRDLLGKRSSFNDIRPGTEHVYTNLGASVVGAVIENAAGKSLDTYAREVLFDRLDIDAAYIPSKMRNTGNIAVLYDEKHEETRSVQSQLDTRESSVLGHDIHLAQGNLTISIIDYARILAMLGNGGILGEVRILSEDSVQAIHTANVNREGSMQGFGVRYSYSDFRRGEGFYWNTGNAYGSRAQFLYSDPGDTNIGVVVVTTGATYSRTPSDMITVCTDLSAHAWNAIFD